MTKILLSNLQPRKETLLFIKDFARKMQGSCSNLPLADSTAKA